MRALSIRQPFAELILRGIKTVELRSRATNVVGERFYIYAAKTKLAVARGQWPAAWSNDLAGARPPPPRWMIELAAQVGMIEPGAIERLPTGVIVGTAVIAKVEPERMTGSGDDGESESMFRWHLADVERARTLRKPTGRPQPVWFKPF
jgi:hypothetical protein